MEGKSGASSRGNSSSIAYIKVVAVKKLVVGYLVGAMGLALSAGTSIDSGHPWGEPVWH